MRDNKKYRIGEASKMLGITPKDLRKLEKEGVIKPLRSNGLIKQYSVYLIKKIQKYIEDNKDKPRYFN